MRTNEATASRRAYTKFKSVEMQRASSQKKGQKKRERERQERKEGEREREREGEGKGMAREERFSEQLALHPGWSGVCVRVRACACEGSLTTHFSLPGKIS